MSRVLLVPAIGHLATTTILAGAVPCCARLVTNDELIMFRWAQLRSVASLLRVCFLMLGGIDFWWRYHAGMKVQIGQGGPARPKNWAGQSPEPLLSETSERWL
jgi:hypothetical protein